MVDFNGKTTIYGIIGNPVSHSLSPLFQNHFIKTTQQNAAYLPFHVQPTCLAQALEGLHAAHIQGLNITVPHKEQVLAFVQADADALTIGAVNTVKRSASGWLATNTDWLGFANVLQGLKAKVTKSPTLIFGAGGTSRAVCHALHQQGAKEILICNRSAERAEKLILALQQTYPNTHISRLDWEGKDVTKQIKHCDTIINTSIVGMNENDVFPFDLHGQGVAIDAVYKPSGDTAFVRAAKKGGFSAVDGLPMLIAQGIASFAFWHQETLAKANFVLPDKLQSLQWVEEQLKRQPLHLPGWGD